MDFIVDDEEAVMSFVASRKLAGQRFSTAGWWPPDRTVLALAGGRVVALAHCVLIPHSHTADASLLAEPRCGAYALKALLHLKGMGFANHWQWRLDTPSPATMAISRQYFDTTLDEGTWAISRKLSAIGGNPSLLRPTPLVASASLLKAHGLPILSKWSAAERSQLLAVSADPSRGSLISPAGFDLHATEILTLAFELLDVPIDVRQHVTRIMLLGLAAAHGRKLAPLMGQHVRTEALRAFYVLNAPYKGKNPDSGLFGFRAQDAAAFQQALREVTGQASPPARLWDRPKWVAPKPNGSNERRTRGRPGRRHGTSIWV